MHLRISQSLKKKRKKIIQVGIWLGSCIFLSSLFSYSIHSFKWTNQLDLKINDALLRLRNRNQTQDDIITLHYQPDKKHFSSLKAEQDAYAEIIKWLLQNQTKVVIVNIPPRWTDKDLLLKDQSKSNRLTELFNHPGYKKKIVLVGYTTPVNSKVQSPIPDFVPLLVDKINVNGFNYDVYSKISDIQGFVEFDPISSLKPDDLESSSRLAHIEGSFAFPYSTEDIQKFKSFAVLAVEKYFSSNVSSPNLKNIQINYLPRHSFKEEVINNDCLYSQADLLKRKPIECQITKDHIPLNEINNKIVILDFSFLNVQTQREGTTSNIRVQSPFDWQAPSSEFMSSLEYQANLVYTLLTRSYYQLINGFEIFIVSSLIGFVECCIIFFTRPKIRFHILSLVLISYVFVIVSVFWLNYILPFSTLVLSSFLTALAAYLIDKNNQLLQEDERNKRLLAEEEATISQAKKLLLRIWSDIHDDSLQELRVAMDDLELANLSDFERQSILQRLSYVGIQIRKHLEIEAIQELSLQPLLREGLVEGINLHLDTLIESGKLTLPVIRDLEEIQEFEANSDWLDAREDIFRFFREQIANVIAHAQGENTTATLVKVHLSQTEDRCLLRIENDGKKITNLDHRRYGGLGTKLSREMAESLPEGHWNRTDLPMGGVGVDLQWKHSF